MSIICIYIFVLLFLIYCFFRVCLMEIKDYMIKGRIAEAIVEDMFNNMGMKVVRFGYENVIPELANKNNLIKGRIADELRGMPDFIVVDPKTNYAYYIEVKYRKNGTFEFKKEYKYPNAFVILVTPKGILVSEAKEVMENSNSFVYLNKHKVISKIVDRDIVVQYIEFVKKYFASDLEDLKSNSNKKYDKK